MQKAWHCYQHHSLPWALFSNCQPQSGAFLEWERQGRDHHCIPQRLQPLPGRSPLRWELPWKRFVGAPWFHRRKTWSRGSIPPTLSTRNPLNEKNITRDLILSLQTECIPYQRGIQSFHKPVTLRAILDTSLRRSELPGPLSSSGGACHHHMLQNSSSMGSMHSRYSWLWVGKRKMKITFKQCANNFVPLTGSFVHSHNQVLVSTMLKVYFDGISSARCFLKLLFW